MDKEVFCEWFEKFANSITERPLLLLFDGYMTHISLPVIQKALDERIIIVKFPPHFTNVLQTLDMSCFGPLKRCWKEILQHRVNLYREKSCLSKGDFVDQLCRIWNFAMTPDNIIGGFSSIGIFPPDRTKYPTNHFNPEMLLAYEKWKESGEEVNWDLVNEELVNGEVPDKLTVQSCHSEISNLTPLKGEPERRTNINAVGCPSRQQLLLDLLGEVPYEAPVGFKWVPNGWKLAHIQSNIETVSEEPSKKFQSTGNKKKTQRSSMNVPGRN